MREAGRVPFAAAVFAAVLAALMVARAASAGHTSIYNNNPETFQEYYDTHACPLTGKPFRSIGNTGRCSHYNAQNNECDGDQGEFGCGQCCFNAEGGAAVNYQPTEDERDSIPDQECKPASRKCHEVYNLLSCRVCDGKQRDWMKIKAGTGGNTSVLEQTICEDFAKRLYNDCQGSEVWMKKTPSATSGTCTPFSDWSSPEDMAEAMGFVVGTSDCFNAAGALRPASGALLLLMLAAAVLGYVL